MRICHPACMAVYKSAPAGLAGKAGGAQQAAHSSAAGATQGPSRIPSQEGRPEGEDGQEDDDASEVCAYTHRWHTRTSEAPRSHIHERSTTQPRCSAHCADGHGPCTHEATHRIRTASSLTHSCSLPPPLPAQSSEESYWDEVEEIDAKKDWYCPLPLLHDARAHQLALAAGMGRRMWERTPVQA